LLCHECDEKSALFGRASHDRCYSSDVIRTPDFSSSGICELIICSAAAGLSDVRSISGVVELVRTGHHHHSIAQCFTAAFIKEWDISKEKIWRVAMRFRSSISIGGESADGGSFKRDVLLALAKHYRAKFRSIQGSSASKKSAPEFAANFVFYLGKLNESGGLPSQSKNFARGTNWRKHSQNVLCQCKFRR
jgi:hypothetical protein